MSTFAKYPLTGAVDGVNTLFTTPLLPTTLEVYKNGLIQDPTAGDYTLGTNTATATVTFAIPPSPGDLLAAWVFNQ